MYVYRCHGCGEAPEFDFPMGEAPIEWEAGCHETGRHERLTRVFTAPGVTFKGPGFYRTDSRGGNR